MLPSLVLTLALVPAASAQVILDVPQALRLKKSDAAKPLPARPTVWPRLDPGAVVCRTADDLERHAANMIARVSGGPTQPADCRIVAQPTAIQIVSREGPGRTQVKANGDADSGWTDAWLPDKAPAGR